MHTNDMSGSIVIWIPVKTGKPYIEILLFNSIIGFIYAYFFIKQSCFYVSTVNI